MSTEEHNDGMMEEPTAGVSASSTAEFGSTSMSAVAKTSSSTAAPGESLSITPATEEWDGDEKTLLITNSFKDCTPDLKFQQLQHEIALMKSEIQDSESTYFSKKSVLEKELRDNEIKYQNKIQLFQKKFAVVSEETKVNEKNYKNEIVLMKEKMQQMEHSFETRLECVQKSMSKDYLMLQMQFEIIKRTNEKQGTSLLESKTDFDKTRTEMKKILKERFLAFQELQSEVKQQNGEFQAVRDDCTAHKEEVEQMFQSWMTQHENLSQQVQGIDDVVKVVKEELVTAEEEREDTRSKMQKLGQTWESLFEHLVGQVHDHAEEQRQATDEQDKQRSKLEQKVEARHNLFDEILQQIQNEGAKQKLKTSSLREVIDRHEHEISTLNETMGCKSVQLDLLEGQLKEQAQEQSSSRVKTTTLQSDIDRLTNACTSRLDTIEEDLRNESESQASTSEALKTDLDSQGFKLSIVDQKISIHETQLTDLSSQVQEQGDVVQTSERERLQAQQDIEKLVEAQKAELDRVSSQVKHNTDELKEENAVTSRSLFETDSAMKTQSAKSVAELTSLRKEVGKLAASFKEINFEKSADKKVEGLLNEHGARLDNLNDICTTHTTELADLDKTMSEQYANMGNALKTTTEETKRDMTGMLRVQKNEIIEDVTSKIQQEVDEQKDALSLVQKNVDDHSAEISAMESKTKQVFLMLDDIARQVDLFQEEQQSSRGDFETGLINLEGLIEERIVDVKEILNQAKAKFGQEVQATNKALTNVNVEHRGSIATSTAALAMLETLLKDVKQQVTQHSESHEAAAAVHASIRTDMKKAAESSNSQIAGLKRKVDEETAELNLSIEDLKRSTEQQVLDRRKLEDKVDHHHEASKMQDKIIKTIDDKVETVKPYLEDLKTTVTKHGGELKFAREERSAMNGNLTKLTVVVDKANKKLSCHFKEQIGDLKAKHDVLKVVVGQQGTQQHDIDSKLKKLTVETREKHETGLRVVGSKIHGTQLQIHDLKSEIAKQADEHKMTNEEYEQFKAKTEMVLDVHSNHHTKTDSMIKQQSEALGATKSELISSLDQQGVTKKAIERSLDMVQANLTKVTDDRMQEMEQKLTGWTKQFEIIASQIRSQAEEAEATKQEIDAVHTELEKVTDAQVKQIEKLVKEVESTDAKTKTALAGKEETTSAVSEVRQGLNELVSTVAKLDSARSNNTIESDIQRVAWESQVKDILQQVKEQEAELQSMKADRSTSTRDLVEKMNSEFMGLAVQVDEQAAQLRKAEAERARVQQELEALRSAHKQSIMNAGGPTKQKNGSKQKRQGLLKEMIATSSDIKRELQIPPVPEDSREDDLVDTRADDLVSTSSDTVTAAERNE